MLKQISTLGVAVLSLSLVVACSDRSRAKSSGSQPDVVSSASIVPALGKAADGSAIAVTNATVTLPDPANSKKAITLQGSVNGPIVGQRIQLTSAPYSGVIQCTETDSSNQVCDLAVLVLTENHGAKQTTIYFQREGDSTGRVSAAALERRPMPIKYQQPSQPGDDLLGDAILNIETLRASDGMASPKLSPPFVHDASGYLPKKATT